MASFRFAFGQVYNEESAKSISIYVLPKHAKYKFKVTQERIKELSETSKRFVNDEKIFNYLSDKLFMGNVMTDITEIDVRLLIEVTNKEGVITFFSISSTDLIQIDSQKIYKISNYNKFLKVFRKYLPANSGW